MRTIYNTPPNIYGILSDDHMFFEGVNRPSEIYSIRDGINEKDNILILEKYLNDLYNLFLRKISTYVTIQTNIVEDSIKLQALLQEIIKVKDLIEKASSPDIMKE